MRLTKHLRRKWTGFDNYALKTESICFCHWVNNSGGKTPLICCTDRGNNEPVTSEAVWGFFLSIKEISICFIRPHKFGLVQFYLPELSAFHSLSQIHPDSASCFHLVFSLFSVTHELLQLMRKLFNSRSCSRGRWMFRGQQLDGVTAPGGNSCAHLLRSRSRRYAH